MNFPVTGGFIFIWVRFPFSFAVPREKSRFRLSNPLSRSIMKVVFLVFLSVTICEVLAKKDASEEDDETASPAEKMVDRLAVNLAGAFVKTVFPEMTRADKTEKPTQPPPTEIRRAPINPLSAGLESYSPGQVLSEYNALPQLGQTGDSPRNPFAYQSQMPAQRSLVPQTQSLSPGSALGGMDFPNLLANGPGTPEAVNAVRNQAYLAELSKHQSELSTYSAKQMEYLDQQRRYQQAMIDHQAGAALLMQKQQQEVINEQIRKMKESYNLGEEIPANNDNTVGGRLLTAKMRGAKTMKVPVNKAYADDEVITSDAHLKDYFKDRYGIEIPDDVTQLSADERATLSELKRQLTKQREKAIEKGPFRTMDGLKGRMKPKRTTKSSTGDSCDQCIPLEANMIQGAWTQIYGNPKSLNKVFGTVMSLEDIHSASHTAKMSKKKVSCVGLEVGKKGKHGAKVNLFFREKGEGNELHEMKGTVAISGDVMQIDTNLYRTNMCLVKAGPSESDRYEYIILAETIGENACGIYHVFLRATPMSLNEDTSTTSQTS
ncbi:unnamed protein product [Caenorhabditis auriculariae]|uniref:Uncharacterized protein n=1 Tax=Caenorhabditis auriculariae TaxID=2777116 RepID=A0A8S1GWB4_9PELO|nr:unnamed protein product [Caenorhabditis auriculariae]